MFSLANLTAKGVESDRPLRTFPANTSKPTRPAVMPLQWKGVNRYPVATEEDEFPTKSNYFIGNDPTKWQTNVRNYRRVRYGSIYRGIDLVYYGNQGQSEHDFVIFPRVDPSVIIFGVRGGHHLPLDAAGNLVMRTAVGELRLLKPEIYQLVNGQRRVIAGGYVIKGGSVVGSPVGRFNLRNALVRTDLS